MFEKMKEQLGKLTSGEFVQEHVQEAMESIESLVPILKKNGYTLEYTELEMGFPTGISLCFVRNENPLGDLSQLAKEYEGKKVKSWIISSLMKVQSSQEKLKKSKMEIWEIEIGLKIPPSLIVRLKPIQDK
jgi:hypothetical protein